MEKDVNKLLKGFNSIDEFLQEPEDSAEPSPAEAGSEAEVSPAKGRRGRPKKEHVEAELPLSGSVMVRLNRSLVVKLDYLRMMESLSGKRKKSRSEYLEELLPPVDIRL